MKNNCSIAPISSRENARKLISILMPTRGRPKLVERFLQSVASNSVCCDEIEVILYLDDDDTGSHGLGCKDVRVERIIGPRRSMGAINSACLALARGDIVILANDDVVIQTRGWDKKVRDLDLSYEDGIYLAYANDLYKKNKFCTFPIISRRVCDLLNTPYPECYQRTFIDVHLFDIFKRLQEAGVDRIRYCEDVIFEHRHFRVGKAGDDENYRAARRVRFADDPAFLAMTDERSQAARKLLGVVNGSIQAEGASRRQLDWPTGTIGAVRTFTREFLFDRELPWRWRVFLWYWFIGRYLAANGHLGWFVAPGDSSK